jgi:nitroreductase
MTTANSRTADHPIAALFLERWSPRAFTGEAIADQALLMLLEAARWAPSSYNSQPWRFLYSKRGSPSWPKFLGLLSERNQSWAQNAAALLVVVSKQTFVPPGQQEPIVSRTHSFDTGAAWANLALQASLAGWHTHAMAGFDVDRTRTELNVPDDYRVEAAIAVGRLGDKSSLPERLQALENPNGRRPLSETVLEGGFPPQR